MNDATPQTLRDLALNSVPVTLRESLLMLAAQHHILAPDDPFWTIAAATANALAAAQAAGEAAANVRTAVAGIQQQVYDGASKASADVKSVIETSIAGTVNASVATAAQAGADALRQAAADLPKVAQVEQGRIVQEWKSALAQAAREHAFSGFLQKLSVNITVLAVLVVGLLIGGAVAGAGGMEYFLNTQHYLTPPTWRLLVDQKGKPLCGPFAGRHVCLVRKAPRP